MDEKRFACTACGKCCYGILPLTLCEAINGADVFPLAISLTPVRQSERHFKLTTQLGTTLHISRHQKMAVLVMPVAYIPPNVACPRLGTDNLCTVHESKPLRCRTMPFYPYYEEDQQLTMLVPRKDWQCDTSSAAPLVYREKKILNRAAFDAERAALMRDAPALRAYADRLLKHNAGVLGQLIKAAQGPVARRVFLNFASFLRIDRRMSLSEFASSQHKVLEHWAEKTAQDASLAEYNSFYNTTCAELARFIHANASEVDLQKEDKII